MSPTPTKGDNNAQDNTTYVADVIPELADPLYSEPVAPEDDEQITRRVTEHGQDDLPILQETDNKDVGELESDRPPSKDELDPTQVENAEHLEDVSSLPDDTPSLKGSLLSSPRSQTPSTHVGSPGRSPPGGIHRPFDHRFQSRLSSYSLPSHRATSPGLLGSHSRKSSFASGSLHPPEEPDESSPPWDVIRWHKLRRITGQLFAEAGKRSFGRPTCLAVTDNIVIGTSKGLILVFDQQENPKAVIGAGTKAAESGSITSLAICADHTTVAAGHSSGHIFTWEIVRPGRPFLHVPPIDLGQAQSRGPDGHISGASILHIGFLGYRHTALVSADDRGMAFSHLATRGMGAVGRTVRTTRILGRYPELIRRSVKPPKQSSVLAFAPLPLGNVEQATDGMGLVAMMTPYLLVIVSTTPVAQTQHKAARAKEIAPHSAMSAALAWFPGIKLKNKGATASRNKLAYCWSNVLTVLEVQEHVNPAPSDKAQPPELQFTPRSRYKCEEAIVAVQWISRSVLAVFTITQQLVILEDPSMHMTDSSDLLQKNIYHADLYSQQLSSLVENLDEEDISMHGVVADAFHMSFRAYKGRLYLLGCDEASWGSLTNWADRLLALMAAGDFIGAIKLAAAYYAGSGDKSTVGLPEDDETRATIVGEKLLEMMSASLRYAFGRNKQAGDHSIQMSQMIELAEACINACVSIDDQEFLFDEVFAWYDEFGEISLFLDVLEPFIIEGEVTRLPPSALKALINTFAVSRSSARLEEIICLLDTSAMDIDQVTTLCRKYNLYDAYIYVWNRALRDYTTPLKELLMLSEHSSRANGHADLMSVKETNAQKIFPYLSFSLTGRIYPTGFGMEEADATLAKTQIYEFFFLSTSDEKTDRNLIHGDIRDEDQTLSYLHKILFFDAPGFISVLNEAFEDSFLNESVDSDVGNNLSSVSEGPFLGTTARVLNRQFIVQIMLEIMSSPTFGADDSIYLDMFIARNLPKYPQYLLLSGTTLQEILLRLCHYPRDDLRGDAQLSVEYLLSVFKPANLSSIIPVLRQARFYRVLKSIFRQEQQYADFISTFFSDEEDQEEVFSAIVWCLQPFSDLEVRQRQEILDVVGSHLRELLSIDIGKTAGLVDRVAPELHKTILRSEQDQFIQFEYLQALFESGEVTPSRERRESDLAERYLQLMCQYRPLHVTEYLDSLADIQLSLENVLPALEEHGIIDAAVRLLARQGELGNAMERLLRHLDSLKTALIGRLQHRSQDSDAEEMFDGDADILERIQKYVGVGIWLCRSQTRNAISAGSSARSVSSPRVSKSTVSFSEKLWVDLINATVGLATVFSSIALDIAETERETASNALRGVVQNVFTAVLSVTAPSKEAARDGNAISFLNILRGFLAHAASRSPSLVELRSVLRSIFSAYAYEESLLELAHCMLDKDVFISVEDITHRRQQGWRPKGQVCEICRRRVWGPGTGSYVWDAWREKENERRNRHHHSEDVDDSRLSSAKGKETVAPRSDLGEEDSSVQPENLGPIVTFACRHIYHQRCLVASQGLEQHAVPRLGLTCPACA